MPDEPLCIGYVAPAHGRGTAGFVLLGLVGVLLAVPAVIAGAATILLAAVGLGVYWRFAARRPLVLVFEDRIEVIRGPQRGVLHFEKVDSVRTLHWGRSWYPYHRESNVLVLSSHGADWQFGVEVAEHEMVQAEILAAFGDYERSHTEAAASEPPLQPGTQ